MNLDVFLVLAGYSTLIGILSLVALYRLRLARAAATLTLPTPSEPEDWPSVLVQLPLYNEQYVAARLIDVITKLDYPRDKLKIQVLDDSTDGTRDVVSRRVDHWQRHGINISHVCRGERSGFKAGALAAGLSQNDSEFVAVFDADFVPQPEFLKQLLPYLRDPGIGMVQARWGHINREDTLLTQAQAILLDGHFVNEHGGRAALGHFFNFNGTAGIWRRQCIDEAGGWSGQTLTEDLELSYRAQLVGWKFIYCPHVEVPAELPTQINAFKTQQYRWAKGSLETAKLLLGRVWRDPGLTFACKTDATMHLLGNLAYPLVLMVAFAMPFVVQARMASEAWWLNILDALLLIGSTGALVGFYFVAERRLGRGAAAIRFMPAVLALGVGLAINNTRAVVSALRARKSAFERTPKLGAVGAWQADPHYLLRADWQALLEFGLGIYLSCAVLLCAAAGWVFALPFLSLFAGGFVYLGALSLWPRIARPKAPISAVDTRTAPKENQAAY